MNQTNHHWVYNDRLRKWYCDICGIDQSLSYYADEEMRSELENKCATTAERKAEVRDRRRVLREQRKKQQRTIFDVLSEHDASA